MNLVFIYNKLNISRWDFIIKLVVEIKEISKSSNEGLTKISPSIKRRDYCTNQIFEFRGIKSSVPDKNMQCKQE